MYQQLELELAPDGSVRVWLLSDYSYYLMSTNMVHWASFLLSECFVNFLMQWSICSISWYYFIVISNLRMSSYSGSLIHILGSLITIINLSNKRIISFSNCVVSVVFGFQLDFGFSGINSDNCGTKCEIRDDWSCVDYTHPDVFEGLQKHTIASELWSLGIVAHYALFGTNPYYKYSQVEDKSMFMNRICMERRNWKRLGPKLRSCRWFWCSFVDFFKICLNRTNDILIDDVVQLYNDLSEERIPWSTVWILLFVMNMVGYRWNSWNMLYFRTSFRFMNIDSRSEWRSLEKRILLLTSISSRWRRIMNSTRRKWRLNRKRRWSRVWGMKKKRRSNSQN